MKSIYIQYEIYILYPIVCLVYLALVVYNRLRSRNTLLYIISWLMITYTVFKIVKTVISFSCVKCSHEQAIYTGVSRTISMMAYFSAHWIFLPEVPPSGSLGNTCQPQASSQTSSSKLPKPRCLEWSSFLPYCSLLWSKKHTKELSGPGISTFYHMGV